MTRYGAMYGPDITFLGVAALRSGRPGVVRGRRRGDPRRALRRRHLAPARHPVRPVRHPPGVLPPARRVAAVAGHAHRRAAGLRVYDAGDVECFSGDIVRSRGRVIEAGGRHDRQRRGDPGRARRRPHDRAARRHRRRPPSRLRPRLGGALRRARRHRQHRVRLAARARPADAPADRVGRGARRPVPADRSARLLARPGDAGLDGRAGHAGVRDERDRRPRPGRRA